MSDDSMSERKLGLVPRLRFPEFREVGEWKKKMLGDFLAYLQPTNYLVRSTEYDDSYQTPVLTAGKTFVLGYTNEKTGIFDKNLPVIIFDDFTTASKFVDFPFKAKSSAMKILLAKKSANIKFIFESMQIIKYEVGDHKRHWISIFEKLPVPIPPRFEEQQKIAACLSSLDALIAALADKLDALKTHKQGLMQQLFPREGETVPRLRFPEFREAGEWESRAIGDVCVTFSGGTPSTTKNDLYGGDIPFIRSAEIGSKNTELCLTKKGLATSSARLVKKGDVLVALYGANSGNVAIAKIDGAINQAILCLRSTYSNPFIYNYLSFLQSWIIKTYLQGGQGNLSGEIVKSIRLYFPSHTEQQKIADCLSSLDALIAAQADKLDALKTHKKGLMQQLFPCPEAVSA